MICLRWRGLVEVTWGAHEVIRVLRSYSTSVIEHNRHVSLVVWCTASFVVETSSFIYVKLRDDEL